jgi:hypothetical protein
MSAWPLSPPGCALSPQVQDGLLAVFVAWFQVRGTALWLLARSWRGR